MHARHRLLGQHQVVLVDLADADDVAGDDVLFAALAPLSTTSLHCVRWTARPATRLRPIRPVRRSARSCASVANVVALGVIRSVNYYHGMLAARDPPSPRRGVGAARSALGRLRIADEPASTPHARARRSRAAQGRAEARLPQAPAPRDVGVGRLLRQRSVVDLVRLRRRGRLLSRAKISASKRRSWSRRSISRVERPLTQFFAGNVFKSRWPSSSSAMCCGRRSI